jgi:hypothetical protein
MGNIANHRCTYNGKFFPGDKYSWVKYGDEYV